MLVFVLFRVALAGQSSDKTSESTNDSMSGVAKTATIVTMSAATGKKKTRYGARNFFTCTSDDVE